GHGELALGHFDVGANRKLGRLSRTGRHGLGPPDRRTDEAFAVGVGGVLLVEHHLLRGRDGRLRGGGLRRRGLRAARLDPVGDLRPRRGGRRHVARGVDRRRAEGTVERHHVRPLPDADADENDNDGGRNETLDQVAVAPPPRRHILVRLFIRVLVVDHIGCGVPVLIRRVGVVERVRRLQHRLRETLLRMRLPPAPQAPPPPPPPPHPPLPPPPPPPTR